MSKRTNNLEKKMEKRFKEYMKKRGWTLRSIEGKAGEVSGTPDVLAISQTGTVFTFELKTLSRLSLGQILILKKSKCSYMVEEQPSRDEYIFTHITGYGRLLTKEIQELEEQ